MAFSFEETAKLPDWWTKLSPKEQEKYLRTHKDSKLAKTVRQSKNKAPPAKSPRKAASKKVTNDNDNVFKNIGKAQKSAKNTIRALSDEDKEALANGIAMATSKKSLGKLADKFGNPRKFARSLPEDVVKATADDIRAAHKDPKRGASAARRIFRAAAIGAILVSAPMLATAIPIGIYLPLLVGAVWKGVNNYLEDNELVENFVAGVEKELRKGMPNKRINNSLVSTPARKKKLKREEQEDAE